MSRRSAIASLTSFLFLAACGGSSATCPLADQAAETSQDLPDAAPADVPAEWGEEASEPDEGLAQDWGSLDGYEATEGGFLWPCSSNDECISGFCVEGPSGNVCTIRCLAGGDCPPDFLCAGIVNTYPDVTFVCLPKFGRLCTPCTTDSQCGGGKCKQFGGEGKYCSVECAGDSECASPYVCRALQGAPEGDPKACMPLSGTCQCRALDAGVKRTCHKDTAGIGTCYGYETCDPAAGFVGCDARQPAAEDCNGIDDDCNGTPDDGLPVDVPCEVTDPAVGAGACKGVNVCLGPQGWKCSAAKPVAETCNGIDDDCNGGTDEPFKNVDGKYATLTDCGACFKSCVDIFPNATPACDATQPVPRCVVEKCDEGFFKLNDFQCIPYGSTLCEICGVDDDCLTPGAKCLEYPDGKYCGNPCDTDSKCPANFHCLAPAGVEGTFCVPDSGTCSCTGDPNVSRTCSQTWTDPDPAKPTYTCKGLQHCEPTGWGACELPAEQCNGADDDCNGATDEGFLVGGKYVTDQNCGVCGNNCAAMPVANGHGVCDPSKTVPDCRMVCNDTYFDVNANPSDGCECHVAGPVDLAGDGVDGDCDGVDGEKGNGYFVAKWGDDANAGTIDAPLLTIQGAVNRAVIAPKKRDVYVATGVYSGPLRLEAGVQVHGGYSADFLVHEPIAYETVILGGPPSPAAPGAVHAAGIAGGAPGSAVFAGFVVIAYDNKAPGGNSIAIWLRDCDATLAVRDSRFVGGSAGDGLPGSPGIAGTDGLPGSVGIAAHDIGKNNCVAADQSAGGAGGARTCGATNVNGGAGGTAICPDFNEAGDGCNGQNQTSQAAEAGVAGSGPAPGTGGTAGLDSFIDQNCGLFGSCGTCYVPDQSKQGGDGQQGSAGTDGPAGSGCSSGGSVSGGAWVPDKAGDGVAGGPGSGGGGGGAAGGVETAHCTSSSSAQTDVGASGGGGGSGGCGATGGTGGGSGGGSFALFLSFSATPASVPSITDCRIEPGRGGNGGNGGNGGVGGRGGNGASGGPDGAATQATFCAAGGGHGGSGGPGGHGAGGGGGCGGPAYGLFVSGAPAGLTAGYLSSGLVFQASAAGGAGGLGGASLGNGGVAGASGAAGDYSF